MLRSLLLRLIVPMLLLALAGCAAAPGHKATPTIQAAPAASATGIADLVKLPQDLTAYLDQADADAPLITPQEQEAQAARFLQEFFSPWREPVPRYSADEVFWGVAEYADETGYGENLQPRSQAWFQHLVDASRMDAFPSMAERAVTVRNTALRAMPTNRPFFKDPARPGEGYPFDYFQNTALWAGTPVLLSHATADGAWLLAETAHAFGWLPARDVAHVDDAFVKSYYTGRYAAVTRDDAPVTDAWGRYALSSHVGSLFPLLKTENDAYQILIPLPDFARDAVIAIATVREAAPFPLPATARNIAVQGNALMGQAYGWGGMYEDRDCSAMLRDLFTPFGFWLPRNSKRQAEAGRTTDVAHLTPEEREAYLVERDHPFLTLVGMPGHIMLYVGTHAGRAALFHNTWGVKTRDAQGNEGRALIGRAVVTTLTPGAERADVDETGDLRAKMTAITILPPLATQPDAP